MVPCNDKKPGIEVLNAWQCLLLLPYLQKRVLHDLFGDSYRRSKVVSKRIDPPPVLVKYTGVSLLVTFSGLQ